MYSKPHIRKVDGLWEVRSKANPLPRSHHAARKFCIGLNVREAVIKEISLKRLVYANR